VTEYGAATLEEAIANIKEAIELYLETLPVDERQPIRY
jgi:predicted RNase H-like HicB family nuclease